MSKETYKLAWMQSTSTVADSQDLLALVSSGGASGIPLVIATNLGMTNFDFTYDFDTDANVEWWVRTYNSDRSKIADSVHSLFKATNEEPLAAATNLSQVWIAHIP